MLIIAKIILTNNGKKILVMSVKIILKPIITSDYTVIVLMIIVMKV